MIHLVLGDDVPVWATWALTLLLHGGLWLAAGWLLCHPVIGLPARSRSWVWRALLCAPLLSATIHSAVVAPWRVAAWEVAPGPATAALPSPAAAAPIFNLAQNPQRVPNLPRWARASKLATRPRDLEAAFTSQRRVRPEVAAPRSGLRGEPGPVGARPRAARLGAEVSRAPVLPPAGGPARPSWPWPSLLLLALVTLALVQLLRLGGRALRFRQTLSPREIAPDGPRTLLAHLCRRARHPAAVRLTTSDGLDCPIALGTREICLPRRSLGALDDRLLGAVLGHELAHLERRDNAWLTAGALLEAVLFFQPFVRLVRRKMQESAELACDNRAVELTQDPVGLARSLAEVASWDLVRAPAGFAHAMASPTGLKARVERLLTSPRDRTAGTARPWAAAALVGLLAVGLAAPSVVPRARADQPAPAKAAANVTPPASPAQSPARVSPAATAQSPAAAAPARVSPAATAQSPAAAAPPVARPKTAAPAAPATGATPVRPSTAPRIAEPSRTPEARVREPRLPRPPRPPRLPRPPRPPLPTRAFAREMAAVAIHESRLGQDLQGARREIERLRAAGAGEAERRPAEQRVQQIERQVEEVARNRTQVEERFQREMEEWGKEMERQGEAYGRQVEEQLKQYEQQVKQNEEQLKLNLEGVKRNLERIKEHEQGAKRAAAEQVRHQAELMKQSARMARETEQERMKHERVGQQAAERAKMEAARVGREMERQHLQIRDAERRAERAKMDAARAAREAEVAQLRSQDAARRAAARAAEEAPVPKAAPGTAPKPPPPAWAPVPKPAPRSSPASPPPAWAPMPRPAPTAVPPKPPGTPPMSAPSSPPPTRTAPQSPNKP